MTDASHWRLVIEYAPASGPLVRSDRPLGAALVAFACDGDAHAKRLDRSGADRERGDITIEWQLDDHEERCYLAGYGESDY